MTDATDYEQQLNASDVPFSRRLAEELQVFVPPRFAQIEVARLNFSIRTTKYTPLHGLPATSLRSMFSRALKLRAGSRPGSLYDQVLNPRAGFSDVPQTPPGSCVLDSLGKTFYGVPKGHLINFGLSLFGGASARVPDIIRAVETCGVHYGLTKDEVPFGIEVVMAVTPNGNLPIFGAGYSLPHEWNPEWSWTLDTLIDHLSPPLSPWPTRVALSFDTPLDLNIKEPLGEEGIQFHHLMTRLFWSAELHARCFGGGSLDVPFEQFEALAKSVVKVSDALKPWHHLSRPGSLSRARAIAKLHEDPRALDAQGSPGDVGEVRFEGNLAPFIPYLSFGRAFGVGKGTHRGLGRFRWWDDTL